jgi:hypothetical protein
MEQGTDANSGGSSEAPKKRESSLQEILSGIERVGASEAAAPKISSIACDSRKVRSGGLFFALPGQKADGNKFVSEAVAGGAMGSTRSWRRASRSGYSGRKLLRASGERSETYWRHRNKRKDHHNFSYRFDFARCGIYNWTYRYHRL